MINSPLAKLPPELRNRIYEEVLVNPRLFMLYHERRLLTWKITPALVKVCRAIHAESIQVLYARNTFCLSGCDKSVRRFLAQIGKLNAQSLRKVVFSRSHWYSGEVARLLESDLEQIAQDDWHDLRDLKRCQVSMQFTVTTTISFNVDLRNLMSSTAQALSETERKAQDDMTKARLSEPCLRFLRYMVHDLRHFRGNHGRLERLSQLFE